MCLVKTFEPDLNEAFLGMIIPACMLENKASRPI